MGDGFYPSFFLDTSKGIPLYRALPVNQTFDSTAGRLSFLSAFSFSGIFYHPACVTNKCLI